MAVVVYLHTWLVGLQTDNKQLTSLIGKILEDVYHYPPCSRQDLAPPRAGRPPRRRRSDALLRHPGGIPSRPETEVDSPLRSLEMHFEGPG